MRRLAAVVLVATALIWAPGGGITAKPKHMPTNDPALASLPSVSSGKLPGPELLYAPPPRAPQLENRHPAFSAAPLLVSGTEAYIAGEWLYQDFLDDDRGADTDGRGSGAQSAAVGNITYPTDVERYANNAADLVEARIASGSDAFFYRFTLNTMRAPDAAIISAAFDADGDPATGADRLPRDPGAPFPGTDAVLTTWGTGAEWSIYSPSGWQTTGVPVVVDEEAAQITVEVPHSVVHPTGTWRATIAAGLLDRETGGWLLPGEQASQTHPGGAPRNGRANGIFNVAPRFDEPVLVRGTPADEAQAMALAADNPTVFGHAISFDRLIARETLRSTPTGTMLRIFPSRLDLGGGRASSFPQFRQQLQAYSLRVPPEEVTSRYGLTMYLHALGEYHWTNHSNPWLQSVGDEREHLVATPLNRGPDGWYIGPAEADFFEVWNDIARHYELDPEFVSIMGTSMGGYGTYRLASLYPDLFANAVTNVGPPGSGIWVPGVPQSVAPETLTNNWLENVRNVPFLNLAAVADELVPLPGPRAQNLGAPEQGIRGFDQLGYRFRFRVYAPAEHVVSSIYSDPAVPAFLANTRVDRSPRRITFRYVPAADDRELGLIHDHAYWISDLRVRGAGLPTPSGTVATAFGATSSSALVDAVSDVHGYGDAPSRSTSDAGLATGPPIAGVVQLAYNEWGREWDAPPDEPKANRVRLNLQSVEAVTVDLLRAGIDFEEAATVEVATDGTSTVVLTGVPRDAKVTGGTITRRADGAVEVTVTEPTTTIRLQRSGSRASR